jgi:hypothetical protein
MADTAREELFSLLYGDRLLAHEWLFEHRHGDKTPDFHRILIEDWHSKVRRCVDMVFRGGGKSTRAEEALIIRAGFKEYGYGLIVGQSFDRAAQRLHAIRYEIETNERLREVFGDLRGPIWGADQLMLSNGVLIQAMGKGMSLRGAKHLDQRPDLLFGDDLEEYDDVRTEKARKETLRWFNFDLLPALDPNYKARVAATPLDPHSLPMELRYSGQWKTRVIPWYYIDPEGNRVPTWPERFPMKDIEAKEDEAQRSGQMRGYRAEYLCQAEAPEDKPFKQEMFRIVPQVRTWQPVYAMFDPARTTHASSALTGYVAWSWIANRLVVWDSWARPLMPDKIIDAVFECDETWNPVMVGVEEDGLNEFLMQPIRQEMLKRRRTVPIKAIKAPKGKLDFIRALQPFFHAREVEFAHTMPDLQSALLSFPSGKIDAPNALAYALPMRPGLPVYQEFGQRHVADNLTPTRSETAWLALNATRTLTSGALIQIVDGAVRVFKDWIYEGEPGDTLGRMVEAANLEAGQGVKLTATELHFDRYNNVGLEQAAKKLAMPLRKAMNPEVGRTWLRDMLQREIRGVPAVMVCRDARWTLNALSGGYCYGVNRQGVPTPYAEEGQYRVLMEGVEGFFALTQGRSTENRERVTNATTPDGRAYRSAMPR